MSVATLNGWSAVSNICWKTWLTLPTVYDFNTAGNWMYENFSNAYLPGTNDVAYFWFYWGPDLWTTRDWRLHFSESITNNGVIARAPLVDHQATFDMDQKSWSLLNDYNLNTGRGGRIVQTNGVLNVGRHLNLSATTDRPELQLQTNGVWVAADMEINVSSNFTVNGVHAVLNAGTNPAMNRVSVEGQMNVGNNSGTGVLSLCGGTYTNSSTTAWHYVGHTSPGYGRLEVSGGTNQIVAAGASMAAGRAGRGALSISGGLTVFKGWCYIAMYAGSECELTVTGGRLDMTHLSVGRIGQGRFTCSGGEVNLTGALYISQLTNGVGAVTISGGSVKTPLDVVMGTTGETVADMTLSGSGLLRCRRIYKGGDATSHAGLLFDGGTLQASTAGTVIDVLDEVCLTTNGLVLDSDGNDVSIRSVLQDQTGHSGSLTKKGAGTLTLAANRTATGPVSVWAGTLAASNTLAVAEGLSTVNGTLTLTSGSLSIAPGAALAGTGAVSSVTLAGNALFRRAKTDGAETPLQADRYSSAGPFTIALTGYAAADLIATLPLIRTPSPIDISQITVTMDGETLSGVSAVTRTDQGQTLLGVKYFNGTLISIR